MLSCIPSFPCYFLREWVRGKCLIPIGSDLIVLLKSRLTEANGSPWVFANPETGKPFVNIFYAWDAAMHDLRHSFASFLINSGHSLYEVQKLFGHRTLSMTQRYAHLSDSSLRSAMESAASIVKTSSPGYADCILSF